MTQNTPMQTMFGAGSMWGVNQSVSNPTPVRFGISQEISVDFSRSIKTLVGQNNLPFAAAPGVIQTKGKVSVGQINGRMVNELFFGGSAAVGQTQVIDNESGTIPASSAYTVTVAQSATWVEDLGVVYTTTGLPLTRVASAPTTGQYSVALGVYTFAAADASKAVNICYTYTTTTTGTQTFTLTQQLMGQANTFQTVITMPYNSLQANIILNACLASKIGLATKLEDFMKPDFEFEAFADTTGTLGKIVVAQAS